VALEQLQRDLLERGQAVDGHPADRVTRPTPNGECDESGGNHERHDVEERRVVPRDPARRDRVDDRVCGTGPSSEKSPSTASEATTIAPNMIATSVAAVRPP
jgi:hypothetical protein